MACTRTVAGATARIHHRARRTTDAAETISDPTTMYRSAPRPFRVSAPVAGSWPSRRPAGPGRVADHDQPADLIGGRRERPGIEPASSRRRAVAHETPWLSCAGLDGRSHPTRITSDGAGTRRTGERRERYGSAADSASTATSNAWPAARRRGDRRSRRLHRSALCTEPLVRFRGHARCQAWRRSAATAPRTAATHQTASTTRERPGTTNWLEASPARMSCAMGSTGRNSCAVASQVGRRSAG
jgi:hypothetical protein